MGIFKHFVRSKTLGPYVMMIGKMLQDLFKFLSILAITIIAFGILRQAVLNPRNENLQIQVIHLYQRLQTHYVDKYLKLN